MTVSNVMGLVTSSEAFLRLSPSSVSSVSALFPLSKVWRFNTNGLDLGTVWRVADFNDSGWPSGSGVIAKEDSGNAVVFPLIGTVINTNNGSRFITNVYFRTHFTITNKSLVSGLGFSNVIDDGGVFYVNGTEVFRYNMPAGTVTASTFASATLTDGVFTVSNVAPTLLVQGDNVLAVEVHQVNNTSSDIVMGSALFNTIATLNFTVAAEQISAFLYLTNTVVSATRTDGTTVIRTLSNWGRIVAIAEAPLVEALMDTNDARSLILYGHIGANHFIESCTNSDPKAAWGTKSEHTLTNLFNTLPLTTDPNPAIFYRLR